MLVSHLEVSDRLSADMGLAQSRELLAGIFNTSLHGIMAFSSVRDSSGSIADFEFVSINTGAERVIGIPADRVLSKRLLATFPEIKENGLFDRMVGVAETGKAFRIEQYLESDHAKGWFNVGIAKFGDGVIASLFDISDIKRSEQARRESEERLRTILDNTEEILYALDAEGSYTHVSPAVLRVLGYPPSDLEGKSISEFTHLDDIQTRVDALEGVLSTGRPARGIQYRLRHVDGTWHWYTTTGSIARDESGGPPTFVGVSYDITAKKRTEQELEHYRTLLEQIARQRKRELDAVSEKLHEEVEERLNVIEKERADIAREVHDELGQSLTALKYDLSWIRQRNAGADRDVHARVEAALTSIESSIKSVRRISTRLRPAVLSDLGLGAAIEWFANDFQSRTGISVELDLPEEDIEMDFERATALFRVFQEALTNVARHARAGSVRVALAVGKELISLSISDDGIGFAPEKLEGSRSFGITGMRERVGFFGGRFEIRGRPGEGARIWVSVPLVKGS